MPTICHSKFDIIFGIIYSRSVLSTLLPSEANMSLCLYWILPDFTASLVHFLFFVSCFVQTDMQRAVEFRFSDTSTLVREAAVELIGRFVLCKPELTLQYYDLICERIRVSQCYSY